MGWKPRISRNRASKELPFTRNCERDVTVTHLLPALDSGLKDEGRKKRYSWVDGHWDDMMYTYDTGNRLPLATTA
jgi:hypothetical protein